MDDDLGGHSAGVGTSCSHTAAAACMAHAVALHVVYSQAIRSHKHALVGAGVVVVELDDPPV